MGNAVDGEVAFDRVMTALGHRDRRRVLMNLRSAEAVAIDHLANDAHGVPADRIPAGSRVALHHMHLPLLDELGYATWTTGTVQRGPRWSEIGPLVDLLHTNRASLPDGWM